MTYKFSRISHYWITYFEKGGIKTRISNLKQIKNNIVITKKTVSV